MTTRNPPQVSLRARIDKLGVKPGLRVAVIDIDDELLFSELRERSDQIVVGMPRTRRDVIFYGAESLNALEELAELKGRIVAGGAIWVVSRKGDGRSIGEDDVIRAASRAGLIDNKVVSFSATHVAVRLVVPEAMREHH